MVPQTDEIRRFILANVSKHAGDIVAWTVGQFGISRQAVNKYVRKLVAEHLLAAEGKTRHRTYRLRPVLESRNVYTILSGPEEDRVWEQNISPALAGMPKNVRDMWQFSFTEMFNNAVDHSGGSEIVVRLIKTATHVEVSIQDNGVGIFRKIQRAMGLLDERHAMLELSKGKLTTDPKRHSGQGIFFTSRLMDSFEVISGDVLFTSVAGEKEDWVSERPGVVEGTAVFLKLNNHSARNDSAIFQEYSSGANCDFTKTEVPVRLAQTGEDKLVSRSQAKRLLSRVELFRTVILNFEGVDSIGQAFADEIFRVFARNHPDIEIIPARVNAEVQGMIQGARSRWADEVGGI